MKKQLFLVLVLVPAFLFSGTVFSAVELVREGKPTAEIIITKDAVPLTVLTRWPLTSFKILRMGLLIRE